MSTCGPDADGSAIVNGREWRWEFHRYLGPTFLKQDGEPRKKFPSEKHPVWDVFEAWHKEYEAGARLRSMATVE